MDKINVLQFCNQLSLGGTERALQVLTKYLDKKLFNVYVAAHSSGGRAKMLEDLGFEVHLIAGDKKRLVDLMRAKNIHILHVHRAGVEEHLPIEAAKEAGVPILIETNVFGYVDKSETGKLIDRHLMVSNWCALRYWKWSEMHKEEFRHKVRVLYNPVDMAELEDTELSNDKVARMRQELGIGSSDCVIGRIGRPAISLWGDLCMNMMPYLVREIPDIKYVMVGAPEIKRKEIQKRGLGKHFIFLETTYDQKKVLNFYNSIDILAYSPGLGESFGYTIAEAMACKKPVVVNSTPLKYNAQIELVDNGKTGFIANYPRDFAQAITFLLRNREKAKEMGIAGYKKVERNYEAAKVTRYLEDIYAEVLLEKGLKLGDRTAASSVAMKSPSFEEDIDKFEKEYEKRLFNCFGRVNRLQSMSYRYLVRNKLLFSTFGFLINKLNW